jgi:hypothetical protein
METGTENRRSTEQRDCLPAHSRNSADRNIMLQTVQQTAGVARLREEPHCFRLTADEWYQRQWQKGK